LPYKIVSQKFRRNKSMYCLQAWQIPINLARGKVTLLICPRISMDECGISWRVLQLLGCCLGLIDCRQFEIKDKPYETCTTPLRLQASGTRRATLDRQYNSKNSKAPPLHTYTLTRTKNVCWGTKFSAGEGGGGVWSNFWRCQDKIVHDFLGNLWPALMFLRGHLQFTCACSSNNLFASSPQNTTRRVWLGALPADTGVRSKLTCKGASINYVRGQGGGGSNSFSNFVNPWDKVYRVHEFTRWLLLVPLTPYQFCQNSPFVKHSRLYYWKT
jgi:hypothetical protein